MREGRKRQEPYWHEEKVERKTKQKKMKERGTRKQI